MTFLVSPLGIILLPLGLFLFLRSRRLLFWATVISIPFFFTYVLDLSFTLVQPYQYFGALLILRHVIDLALRRGGGSFSISPPTAALVSFLFLIYLSLFMPAVLQGSIYVIPSGTRYQEFENVEPLRFRISNLTQTVYPTFMVVLFMSLVRELKDLRTVKQVIRVNVFAAGVVIASGVFFQISIMAGFRDPVEAMFWAVTGFSDVSRIYYGSTYNMIGAIPRMFTLTGEPGYTAAFLVFIFAILVALDYNVIRNGWKLQHNRIAETMLLAGLVLAGSTTGYLGIVAMVAVLLALPRLFRLGFKGYRFRSALLVNVVLVLVVAALAIAAPIVMETSFLDYAYRTHYAKLFEEGGSGSVRLATVTSGVKVFLASPIFGVGYGSHRTGSLLTSLLSNVGGVGTVAFFLFNFLVFRRGLRVCRSSDNRHLVSICYALLVSFSTLFPVMLIGKSMIALVQGWYWLLLALVEGCYRIHVQESRVTATEAAVAERGPVTASAQAS